MVPMMPMLKDQNTYKCSNTYNYGENKRYYY